MTKIRYQIPHIAGLPKTTLAGLSSHERYLLVRRHEQMQSRGVSLAQLQAASCAARRVRKLAPITLPTPDHPALRKLMEDDAS